MGEAKRRKQQDKNFGSPLTIKLIEKSELTSKDLIELVKSKPIEWFGEISKGELKQQCGLVPFNNTKLEGKIILSCHILLFEPFVFQLKQKEIDLLASSAISQIIQKKADYLLPET